MTISDYEYLAELLYPDVTMTPEELELRYPPRSLPEGAKVTRFSPSPTGFVHFGGLYQAVADERLAHLSGGVFYLRIEDTDTARTVENGVQSIIRALEEVGVRFDEGATADGDKGDYGPYIQSRRIDIYRVYAKKLVREGKAYPCFCTPEELADIRARQEAEKADPGYYGKWAVWRDAPLERIREKLERNAPFVLRFRCEDKPAGKYTFRDYIKGDVEITENDKDHVIMKSDSIPPYAFAHAVDDHLMRTTHVVRGEEWLPSLPFHIQLFRALDFKLPKYCHTALILKQENGGKRKISKRKDPEAALDYYISQGIPLRAFRDYMLTLLNSNFEEWRRANPDADSDLFPFSPGKMSVSGALFDADKLNDICKNTVAAMSADEVYGHLVEWASRFDEGFCKLLTADEDYAKAILAIGRGGRKPRKDFGRWSEVKSFVSFFYDELFERQDTVPAGFSFDDVREVTERFCSGYDPCDTQDEWFAKVKNVAAECGFCPDMKLYKVSPDGYKGSIADVSMFLRVGVTGRMNSPDLYEVMKLLGKDRVVSRLKEFVS